MSQGKVFLHLLYLLVYYHVLYANSPTSIFSQERHDAFSSMKWWGLFKMKEEPLSKGIALEQALRLWPENLLL